MNLHPRHRALLGGCAWLVGSVILLWRGAGFWLDCYEHSPGLAWGVLAAALLIGGAKGIFVLRRSADRMLKHIESRPGKRPFWETWPLYFIPLVLLMIGMGVGIRMLWGPDGSIEYLPAVVSGIYLGIGAALFTSSWPYFAAWRRLP